jgi:hypothetical protein
VSLEVLQKLFYGLSKADVILTLWMESPRPRSSDHFVSWRLFRCEGGATVAGDHAHDALVGLRGGGRRRVP